MNCDCRGRNMVRWKDQPALREESGDTLPRRGKKGSSDIGANAIKGTSKRRSLFVSKDPPLDRSISRFRFYPILTDRSTWHAFQYACRKTLADSRPRVRGRFAKNGDEKETADMAAFNGYESSGGNQSHAFGRGGGNGSCDWWSPQTMMAADEDELYGDGGFLESFADHDAFAMNNLS